MPDLLPSCKPCILCPDFTCREAQFISVEVTWRRKLVTTINQSLEWRTWENRYRSTREWNRGVKAPSTVRAVWQVVWGLVMPYLNSNSKNWFKMGRELLSSVASAPLIFVALERKICSHSYIMCSRGDMDIFHFFSIKSRTLIQVGFLLYALTFDILSLYNKCCGGGATVSKVE